MKIIIVEKYHNEPHLECSGEIAIRLHKLGHQVCWYWLEGPNQEWGTDWKSVSARKRVQNIITVLKRKGVKVHRISRKRISRNTRNDLRSLIHSIKSIEQLKNYKYRGASIGIGVASSLISRTGSPTPSLTPETRNLTLEYLQQAIETFEQVDDLLDQSTFDEIILFNGRFSCAKAIDEAGRLRGIPRSYHDRGANFQRFNIRRNGALHDFARSRRDIQKAWNISGEEREIIGRLFFNLRAAGKETNWFSFCSAMCPGALPDLKEGLVTWVYFSSSDDEYASLNIDNISFPGITCQGLFEDQRDCIKWLIEIVDQRGDIQLVIRTHPHLIKKDPIDRTWWESLTGSNIVIVPADSPVDSYALMDAADIVLVFGSTAGSEAAFRGKPTICLADAQYLGLGAVYEPKNLAELSDLLSGSPPPALLPEKILPYGYWGMTKGIPYQVYIPEGLFRGSFYGSPLGQLNIYERFYERFYDRFFGRLKRKMRLQVWCLSAKLSRKTPNQGVSI